METISPTRCVACDAPGSVLCDGCASSLPFIDLVLACPRCGAPYGRVLCTECPMPGSEEALLHPEEAFPFSRARSALSFEGAAKKIIRTYKDGDELRLDAVIASLLCAAMRGRRLGQMDRSFVPLLPGTSRLWDKWTGHLSQMEADDTQLPAGISSDRAKPQSREISPSSPQDWSQWADALTYVPASPEALRRRGFDHMERVAQVVARRTELPLVRVLASHKGAHDQRELGRGERLANRSGSFSLAAEARRTDAGNLDASGAGAMPQRIVLIDDVFTTGATLSAATHALLDGGAREVRTVTCCRVW